jgi:multiple sugar transport system permease protein
MMERTRNGLITEIGYKKLSNKIIYWSIITILSIIAAICILPVAWVLISSLKSLDEFYSVPPTLWPKSFHFEMIPELFSKYDFTKLYINTAFNSCGVIIFAITVNGLMGYALSKMKVSGGKIVFMVVLATYMLPTTVCMVPIYKNIINFPILGVNLLNTNWPMWLMAGANAYYVIVFKSFFDGIPTSLLEAGKLDGCGDFTSFIHIVFPLSKPIISTIIILSFSSSWGDFFWPYMVLKKADFQTVMVRIYAMQSDTSIGINTLLLAISFAIIPPGVVFFFCQKKIMNGFMMSGIKG